MTYNQDRYRAFEYFACDTNGNSLRRRIHAMARHYVSSHVAKLDPNWHSVEISFDDMHRPSSELIERPLTDKDACRVEFDYRPSEFVLVGPKVGHVNLMEQAFQMIPEPLFMLMRACDVMKAWFHTLYNPKHVIELVDGKTVIDFENCEHGVVRNVNGEKFDVEYFGCTPSGEKQLVEHYTLKRLLREMQMDEMRCQAVGVDYFPFLPFEGMSRNTVEEYNEYTRIACARHQAKREAERAQQEAEEAAAYAALSPEERATVDARRAEMAAQAQLVHGLMPLLPHP